MGVSKKNRMKEVGKEHGRMKLARLLAVAVLVAFLVTVVPSVSFLGVADTEAGVEFNTTKAIENAKGYKIGDESLLAQIPGLDPVIKDSQRTRQGGFEVVPIPTEELRGMLLPNYVNEGLTARTTNPSPEGLPDPEPHDAPFLAADILVYDDPANSEKNVSMASMSNGDIYIVYDHDIGTGLRDVYVSKSTDGGSTWAKRDIAVDAGEDESCPSIASSYSTVFGMELLYVWYGNPQMEFAWSSDGDTWTVEDFGGGFTFWDTVSCPYVVVQGDFIFIAAQKFDDQTKMRDTWYILYTLDNFQTTISGYYWIMWDTALVYQPRATIIDDDEIFVAMDIYDQTDANPANWWHDTLMAHGILKGTGDPNDDNWDYWVWGSGLDNDDYTSPTVEANGVEVVFSQEMYKPGILPLDTRMLICVWTDQLQAGSTVWTLCFPDESGWLAFDVALDQRYPMFHREGSTVHAVWMNGTDINYRYSPDGGNLWYGDPTTGDPMKVNEPGVGTVLNAWHSPDIVFAGGKPRVAWHDTRGGDAIYFQSYGNVVLFTIDTEPRDPNLQVREVTDNWQFTPATYLWTVGTNHDIECTPSYADGQVRYTFSHWKEDGSVSNPRTITVNDTVPQATCVYTVEYWLEMINPVGNTTPASGYQLAGSSVTISAGATDPSPDSHYTWQGWVGTGDISYTGPIQTCVGCVIMNSPITETATWILSHNVTIYTNPSGLTFKVDGVDYLDGTSFWFIDSQFYELNVTSPQSAGPVLRWVWSNWSDGGPQRHNVFVTQPTIFIANFLPEYYVTFTTDPPGLSIQVGGTWYTSPHYEWCLADSGFFIYVLSPQDLGVPGEQYAFRNWSDDGTQQHFYTCSAPEIVTAFFVLQYQVTIDTSPTGYDVYVDGQLKGPTPQTFWWNVTSHHVLEAQSTISLGANHRLNFSRWSNAGPRVQDYWANASETLTAVYDTQHRLVLQGNYTGISVKADGYNIVLNGFYWCNDGQDVLLEADTYQYFGDIRYVFERWSDGGAQSHFYTCSDTDVITVYYREEFRVRLFSTLDLASSTLIVTAGGIDYTTPRTDLWWPSYTTMELGTYEFQPEIDPATGTRSKFANWTEGGSMTRSVTINQPGMNFTANFRTQHKLTFVDSYGVPQTTPQGDPVTDGYYFFKGTDVIISTNLTVDVTATQRWRFDGWTGVGTGSYTGPDREATVTMGNPITQTAGWQEQYLLTITTDYGTPDALGYWEKVDSFNYWYDKNDVADFWVPASIDIATGEKAVFDSWSGDATGTQNRTTLGMAKEMSVTANWHLEFLVTIDVAGAGDPPTPEWVEEGSTYTISTDEYYDEDTTDHTRLRFDHWTCDAESEGNGGYKGTDLSHDLVVIGPITQTKVWVTQYEVTIRSVYQDEPETLGNPRGAGWYDEGETALVEVDGSETKGNWVYTFKSWVGDVLSPDLNVTTTYVDEPKALEVQWTKKKKEDLLKLLADLWWIWVIIIIVVVVVVALLLMMRKKPAPAEEMPPPVMEEAPPAAVEAAPPSVPEAPAEPTEPVTPEETPPGPPPA